MSRHETRRIAGQEQRRLRDIIRMPDALQRLPSDEKAHDVRVAKSIGMGLDESAVKAVQKWKFKPSEYQGKPVPVQINVEVDFRLN
jgi:TonB family protein